MSQPDDLIRLYRWEWATVYSVYADDENTTVEQIHDQARHHYTQCYQDRVDPHHFRLRPGYGDELCVHLQLLLPVLKGEFAEQRHARAFAEEQQWNDPIITVRHSQQDRQLRNYGVTKL